MHSLLHSRKQLILLSLGLLIPLADGFLNDPSISFQSHPNHKSHSLISTQKSKQRQHLHKCFQKLKDSDNDGIQFSASGENRRSFISNLLSTTAATTIASIVAPQSAIASTSTAAASTAAITTPAFTSEVSWPLGKVAFSLLPLAGTSSRRATVEEEIIPGKIWTHDQIQGIVNVNVPVRQTVIKVGAFC